MGCWPGLITDRYLPQRLNSHQRQIPRGTLNTVVLHHETSARTGHQLSSFADGSDCPTIGPDGECCRCIGQALPIISHGPKGSMSKQLRVLNLFSSYLYIIGMIKRTQNKSLNKTL